MTYLPQNILRRGRLFSPEMERRDYRASARTGAQGMAGQFVGIETIPVHALVVRLAHKPSPVFHHEAIIHPRVFIRREGEVIVVQLGHELVAEIFLPVRRLV